MKNQKGITLIALVITIIVLLILAGVSISMVIGNNGILNQASVAGEETKIKSEQEQVELALLAAKMLEYTEGKKVDAAAIIAELAKIGVDAKAEPAQDESGNEQNENKSIEIIVTNSGKKYSIKNDIVTVTDSKPEDNKQENMDSEEKQNVELAYLAVQVKVVAGEKTSITAEDIKNELIQMGESEVNVTSDGDKIIVTFANGNKYTIENSGTVIADSNNKYEEIPEEDNSPEAIVEKEQQQVELAYLAVKTKVLSGEKTGITAEDIKNELIQMGETGVEVSTYDGKILVEFNTGNCYEINDDSIIIESNPNEDNSEKEKENVELAYLSVKLKVMTGEKTEITAEDIKNELVQMGDTAVEVTSNGNEIIVKYPTGNIYVIQNDTVTKQ